MLDRLLNNPWAQPPLASDWEVHPTYPRHTVPYYLAPLWDANLPTRQEAERKRREAVRKHVEGQTEAQSKVPKELRQKLKKAKAAKGLLQVLEEEVRKFIRTWEEKTNSKEEKIAAEVDSEDEEIVFVGRNGHMDDMPRSPEASYYFVEDEIQSDRLIFDSMADDHGASFGYALEVVKSKVTLLTRYLGAGWSTPLARTTACVHGPLPLVIQQDERHTSGSIPQTALLLSSQPLLCLVHCGGWFRCKGRCGFCSAGRLDSSIVF
jgi:hypothetical protein